MIRIMDKVLAWGLFLMAMFTLYAVVTPLGHSYVG